MSLWPALALAITSNLDDLSVGVSLGLKGDRLPWPTVLMIAFFSGLTMFSGLLLGSSVAHLLPERLASYASAAVFAGFGVWFIREGRQEAASSPLRAEAIETKQPGKLSWWRGLLLGLALGVDSLLLGVSGGLAGYAVVFTTAAAFGTSLLFIWSGAHLGQRLSERLGAYATYLGAGLLFLLAALEIT